MLWKITDCNINSFSTKKCEEKLANALALLCASMGVLVWKLGVFRHIVCRIDILRQLKAIAPLTNRNLVASQRRGVSLLEGVLVLVHSAYYIHREVQQHTNMQTIKNKKDYNVKDYNCVHQDIYCRYIFICPHLPPAPVNWVRSKDLQPTELHDIYS